MAGQVYIFIDQVVSLKSPLNSSEGSDRIHPLKIWSVIFLARRWDTFNRLAQLYKTSIAVISVMWMHGQSHWTTFYELICGRCVIWGSVAKQSLYNLSVATTLQADKYSSCLILITTDIHIRSIHILTRKWDIIFIRALILRTKKIVLSGATDSLLHNFIDTVRIESYYFRSHHKTLSYLLLRKYISCIHKPRCWEHDKKKGFIK